MTEHSRTKHLRADRHKNARLGGLASGPLHSRDHMAELGRVGGRAKKPGLQNNRFTSEAARAAQLKSAAARKGKRYRKRTNLWGVPRS